MNQVTGEVPHLPVAVATARCRSSPSSSCCWRPAPCRARHGRLVARNTAVMAVVPLLIGVVLIGKGVAAR